MVITPYGLVHTSKVYSVDGALYIDSYIMFFYTKYSITLNYICTNMNRSILPAATFWFEFMRPHELISVRLDQYHLRNTPKCYKI